MIRKLLLLATVCLVPCAHLSAQTNPTPGSAAVAKSGKAQIIGVVIDSLHGGFLAHASILIDGMQASAETDSLGRFAFDSLPAGTFQLGVFHPRLDTLDLQIMTKPFHVAADSVVGVIIAVPSASTIIRDRCSVTRGPSGASALVGEVRDPETLQPVPGAEVSIAWTQITISRNAGIQHIPHLVRDTTDKAGTFELCGLPNSMVGTLQARRGASVTAEIPARLGDRPIELTARTILLSSTDSTIRTGSATVTGAVTMEDGAPSVGSRVELLGTGILALTDAKGEFAIRNAPSGSRMLLTRHLGYSAETTPVDLSSHEQQRVAIRLNKFVPMMDPVLVTARRNYALDKVGFGQRRKSGAGYFMGPERLVQLHPHLATDVLRMVPGLRTVRTESGEEGVESTHDLINGCVDFYVDGVPFLETEPGELNHFVNGGEITAVEVYQSGLAPAEYALHAGSCTTILLWTRFKTGSE